MKYNLTKNSNTYISDVGNVDLTVSQISDLVDYNVSNVITISGAGDHIFGIETDLGVRIKVGEIQYFFDSSTSSGTVAATICFGFKNESFENYSELDTQIGNGYYYATISGVSSPRFVRCVSTLSGTEIIGTINSFGILNSDEIVDFGPTGNLLLESTSTSVFPGEDSVKSVAIYNDGIIKTTAYVSLEPQDTNIDDLLSISNSADGPWYGVNTNNTLLSDNWSYGTHSQTEIVADELVLVGGQTEGTYRTKIFYDDAPSHIRIKANEPDNSMVTKDVNKDIRTIEVKSVNEKPIDYSIYRRMWYSSSACPTYQYSLYYYDSWRHTGGAKYTSSLDMACAHRATWTLPYITIDSNTEKTVGIAHTKRQDDYGSNSALRLYTISSAESYSDKVLCLHSTTGNISYGVYNILSDSYGGMWVYFYSVYYGMTGYTVDNTGYYLAYFTSGFSNSYKLFNTSTFVYDCDVIYSTKGLWYTDILNNLIRRINDYGADMATYYDGDATSLRGICVDSSGGCWYVKNGKDLVHLDINGNLIETLEDVDSGSLDRICIADDESFYVCGGNYVKRVFLDGTIDFSIEITSPSKLFAMNDGVWVRCGDNYYRFINKTTKTVDRTVYYAYVMGFIDCKDDGSRASRFPTAVDSAWNDTDWIEVRTDDYIFPADKKYRQLRLTLRAGDGGVSPEVEKINVQKNVTVPNIYPKNYKNVYLRTKLPSQDLGYVGDYNTNLRAFWEVPT